MSKNREKVASIGKKRTRTGQDNERGGIEKGCEREEREAEKMNQKALRLTGGKEKPSLEKGT